MVRSQRMSTGIILNFLKKRKEMMATIIRINHHSPRVVTALKKYVKKGERIDSKKFTAAVSKRLIKLIRILYIKNKTPSSGRGLD